jgi:hypothetical protein
VAGPLAAGGFPDGLAEAALSLDPFACSDPPNVTAGPAFAEAGLSNRSLSCFWIWFCLLMWILPQPRLVDVAAIHADIAVDDLHRACASRRSTLSGGRKLDVKAAITVA